MGLNWIQLVPRPASWPIIPIIPAEGMGEFMQSAVSTAGAAAFKL
jgi:hypothetical protein